jgi:hypothetical protein
MQAAWDGKPRLSIWLSAVCNVPADPYYQAVARCFILTNLSIRRLIPSRLNHHRANMSPGNLAERLKAPIRKSTSEPGLSAIAACWKLGLIGDVKEMLAALLPSLSDHMDRRLDACLADYAKARKSLDALAESGHTSQTIHPQYVRAFSARLQLTMRSSPVTSGRRRPGLRANSR